MAEAFRVRATTNGARTPAPVDGALIAAPGGESRRIAAWRAAKFGATAIH